MKNYLTIYCLAFLLILGSIDIALCNSTHSLSIQIDTTDTLKINKTKTDSVESGLTAEPADTSTLIDDFLESTVTKVIAFIVPIIALFVALYSKQRRLWWKRKWDLSYQRYLKNIQTKFRNEEDYEIFSDLGLISESSEDSNNGSTISDIISSTDKVHIKGKPGAGKTSLIKKFFVELSKKREKGKSDLIPIYLEYRGKGLFNQIRSNFSSNELFTNTELLTLDWIKTQIIDKKQYIICIDDVHNLLTDTKRKRNSEIEDLVDYNNQFILISRDYLNSFSLSGFEHYKIQDLSNDWKLIEQVLHTYTDEAKAKRIQGHLKHGMDEKLMRLYNTPQHLKFLAKVFDPEVTLEDNKSSLFNRFLNVRDEEAKKESSFKSLDLFLKKRILGYIAFNLFTHREDDEYSVSVEDFRKLLKKIFDELDRKYGLSEYSVPLIQEILIREGYLIKTNGSIRFEHSQWQEFFAAVEIYKQEKSIEPFISKSFGKEIALFVSGLFEANEYRSKSNFWDNFWEDIIREDYFLTGYCIENRIGGWKDEVQPQIPDETELRTLYEKLLLWYENIIKIHFPALAKKFIPEDSKKAGILVEKNRDNKVWHNYYAIKSEETKNVSIFDYNEVIQNKDFPDSHEYYKKHFAVPTLHNLPNWPNVPDSPVVIAHKDVKRQLKTLVKAGELIETKVMDEEALFIEAVTLSAKIEGRFGGFSNISKHKVLPVGKLLSGIERFKNDDFVSSFKVPDARHSNLGRKVTFKEFEKRFKKYIQTQNLESEDNLVPPNADLIDVIKNYRLNDEKLIKEHREFLIMRSARFYKDVYKNYKEVIETNFPTAKYSFRSYNFPIQIFLLQKENNNEKAFGIRLVYFGVDGVSKLKDPVNVRVVDEKEIPSLKNEFKGYSGYNYAWRLNSFSIIEPLRNAVYQLINSEYRDLERRY